MMKDYSGILKAIRKSGLTEMQLCELANVSNTVIQNLRNGGNVTVDSLDKIFKAINADPKDFIIFKRDEKKK